MAQELKQCTRCKKWKPVEDFPFDKRAHAPVHRKRCIACSKSVYVEPGIARDQRLNNQEAYLLTTAKQRAKRKGLDFNIELGDIFIPSHCPLLGIKIVMLGDPSQYNSPTVDRIDPNQGYVKGNVWVISKRANAIKSNATLAEIAKVATGLLAMNSEDDEVQDISHSQEVSSINTEALLAATRQLNLAGERTPIDCFHAIKQLHDLCTRNEEKVSQIRRSISESLAIAKTPLMPVKVENYLRDDFLRIRIDGLIVGSEKEIICSPGKTRYDSFAVTDTGKPLRGERGLTAVMESLRKDIQKLLRSYGIKKSIELRDDRDA